MSSDFSMVSHEGTKARRSSAHRAPRADESGRPINDALQALAESLTTKVHQQPERLLGQSQIGQQLFRMHRRAALQRFDFNNQRVFNYQISAKRVIDFETLE